MLRYRKSILLKVVALAMVFVFSSQQVAFAKKLDLRDGAGFQDFALAIFSGFFAGRAINPTWNVVQMFAYTYLIPVACDWAVKKMGLKGTTAAVVSSAMSALVVSSMDYANSNVKLQETGKKAQDTLSRNANTASNTATKTAQKGMSSLQSIVGKAVGNTYKSATTVLLGKAGAAVYKAALADALTAAAMTAIKAYIAKTVKNQILAEALGYLAAKHGGQYLRQGLQKEFGVFVYYDPELGPTAAKATDMVKVSYYDENGELVTRVVTRVEFKKIQSGGGVESYQELGKKVSVWVGDNKVKITYKDENGNEVTRIVSSKDAEKIAAKRELTSYQRSGKVEYMDLKDALQYTNDQFNKQSRADDARVVAQTLLQLAGLKKELAIMIGSGAGSWMTGGSLKEGLYRGAISAGLQYLSRQCKSPLHGAVFAAGATAALQYPFIKKDNVAAEAASLTEEQINTKLDVIDEILYDPSLANDEGVAAQKARAQLEEERAQLEAALELRQKLDNSNLSPQDKKMANALLDLQRGKKDLRLFYALLSSAITNANASFYSFGRASPQYVVDEGRLQFDFNWTSGNDVFFLNRYTDYVKDVHENGWYEALVVQYVNALHYQAVNNVYSIVSGEVQSSAFVKRLLPYYWEKLKETYGSLRRDMEEALAHLYNAKKDLLDKIERATKGLNLNIGEADKKRLEEIDALINNYSGKEGLTDDDRKLFADLITEKGEILQKVLKNLFAQGGTEQQKALIKSLKADNAKLTKVDKFLKDFGELDVHKMRADQQRKEFPLATALHILVLYNPVLSGLGAMYLGTDPVESRTWRLIEEVEKLQSSSDESTQPTASVESRSEGGEPKPTVDLKTIATFARQWLEEPLEATGPAPAEFTPPTENDWRLYDPGDYPEDLFTGSEWNEEKYDLDFGEYGEVHYREKVMGAQSTPPTAPVVESAAPEDLDLGQTEGLVSPVPATPVPVTPAAPQRPGGVDTFMGHTIIDTGDGYEVGGELFSDYDAAEAYSEELLQAHLDQSQPLQATVSPAVPAVETTPPAANDWQLFDWRGDYPIDLIIDSGWNKERYEIHEEDGEIYYRDIASAQLSSTQAETAPGATISTTTSTSGKPQPARSPSELISEMKKSLQAYLNERDELIKMEATGGWQILSGIYGGQFGPYGYIDPAVNKTIQALGIKFDANIPLKLQEGRIKDTLEFQQNLAEAIKDKAENILQETRKELESKISDKDKVMKEVNKLVTEVMERKEIKDAIAKGRIKKEDIETMIKDDKMGVTKAMNSVQIQKRITEEATQVAYTKTQKEISAKGLQLGGVAEYRDLIGRSPFYLERWSVSQSSPKLGALNLNLDADSLITDGFDYLKGIYGKFKDSATARLRDSLSEGTDYLKALYNRSKDYIKSYFSDNIGFDFNQASVEPKSIEPASSLKSTGELPQEHISQQATSTTVPDSKVTFGDYGVDYGKPPADPKNVNIGIPKNIPPAPAGSGVTGGTTGVVAAPGGITMGPLTLSSSMSTGTPTAVVSDKASTPGSASSLSSGAPKWSTSLTSTEESANMVAAESMGQGQNIQ